jgi:hypothetical protein
MVQFGFTLHAVDPKRPIYPDIERPILFNISLLSFACCRLLAQLAGLHLQNGRFATARVCATSLASKDRFCIRAETWPAV